MTDRTELTAILYAYAGALVDEYRALKAELEELKAKMV